MCQKVTGSVFRGFSKARIDSLNDNLSAACLRARRVKAAHACAAACTRRQPSQWRCSFLWLKYFRGKCKRWGFEVSERLFAHRCTIYVVIVILVPHGAYFANGWMRCFDSTISFLIHAQRIG
jgi:hypothetical protein